MHIRGMHLDEKQLYKAVQESEENALSKLFERYYERLCIFCLRLSVPTEMAEEIVSDIFVRLWNNRSTQKIENLRAFLYTSAKNGAINWLKSKERSTALKSNDEHACIIGTHSHEKKIVQREELNTVYRIIAQMPRQRRTIFMLNRIDSLKYKEIAEVLAISPHTVQNQMVLAVKFLAEHYPNKKTLR